MNDPGPAVSPLLRRLHDGGREGAVRLLADLQKGARELAALSLNFNGHTIRAGVHGAAMGAIDAQLDDAATALARALFDLQQRLLLDVQALARLERIEHVVDLEDDRPLGERILSEVESYVVSLSAGVDAARRTVVDTARNLRILANNTEISASRVGARTGAPVELFVAIASQMRGLAQRLAAIGDDLTIFEQTQGGHAEAVRLAQAGAEPSGASYSRPAKEAA